jgi:hypothetical protein
MLEKLHTRKALGLGDKNTKQRQELNLLRDFSPCHRVLCNKCVLKIQFCQQIIVS